MSRANYLTNVKPQRGGWKAATDLLTNPSRDAEFVLLSGRWGFCEA